jgi:hypothetical protein
MRSASLKWILVLVALALVCGGGYIYSKSQKPKEIPEAPAPVVQKTNEPKEETIGTSVQNRAIKAYTYGTGKTNLLFVGGMHGGYEWNAVLLAYQFMDYLKQNPSAIPDSLSLTIIPELNIDGVYKVTGKEGPFIPSDVSTSTKVDQAGRFNADAVDLNRNFDCKWQPKATWQNKSVSAGTGAFSEPESKALRDFVLKTKPSVAVFWHSQANAVYASECKSGILPLTLDSMNAYAHAAGYPAVKSFDAYPVTGDSEGWLASINIPAITVELKTHETTEWDKNLAGIKSLLDLFSKK